MLDLANKNIIQINLSDNRFSPYFISAAGHRTKSVLVPFFLGGIEERLRDDEVE